MMMQPLIFAAVCDFAGKVRGKAFPEAELERRVRSGIGWTPANVQINCFDGIAENPFGALGDLLLMPDLNSFAEFEFACGKQESLILSDIFDLDGKPWDYCTRNLLKSALSRLKQVSGANLTAAFEHEFQLKSDSGLNGEAYGRNGFEVQRLLLEEIMRLASCAKLVPDSIMKEYGLNQFEVVIKPKDGISSADDAVFLRELVRSAARHAGETATFTPIRDPSSVGNGVHIHISFSGENGEPLAYNPDGPSGMSDITAAFAAGVLKYLDCILAITAPAAISYLRLTPHRWSAAYNNLGLQDREASLRICPTTSKDPDDIARQFNIEFRAADAAACPHLALAAIVHAGAQGIEDGLCAPIPTSEDLSQLEAAALWQRGLVRLPESLKIALNRLKGNSTVAGWFPEGFVPLYMAHKESEFAHVANMDDAARCTAYETAY